VLLDRRMPGLSGDNALNRIREREYDCRVAMVTAVDP
jgi:DNA-binding response OmpR family regulator